MATPETDSRQPALRCRADGPERVQRSVRRALLWPRLQLALKAGLAAGIAFAIAPFMPGSAAEYPYYAPLGALVAMYENVAGSMRQGLQTLVGLAIGIGLAFVLFSLGAPSPLTVAVVMGLGVILAGLPRIGSGRDWIPTAALLVLLVGGHNPDKFSFGYLLQMGVGVTVGIVVNLLVFPPLHFRAAALSIAELRLALAQQLWDMGKALKESWPPEHEDWSRRSEALAAHARSVRARRREGRRQPAGQSPPPPASARHGPGLPEPAGPGAADLPHPGRDPGALGCHLGRGHPLRDPRRLHRAPR